MQLFGKDLSRDVAVIAEIGVNHEGNFDKALELVRLAAEAGADAVKFQSYAPERLTSSDEPERLARVTRYALDVSAHHRLADEARNCGIAFFSSAITEDTVQLIASLAPAIKIASGDLDFEPVIRAAAASGRIVLLSTGTGTIDEVDRAVGWVRDEIGSAPLMDRLVLFQCVSAYPAPIEEAQTAVVTQYKSRYGIEVGYSNHVIGPEACYAAVALGASVLEVHFTDCKTGRMFRDHSLSFEPADLADLVAKVGRIRAAIGSSTKGPQTSESASILAIRKGVVAARDIAEGTVLAREDLMFARPASEFPSAQIGQLPGKRLKRSLKRGQVIKRSDV